MAPRKASAPRLGLRMSEVETSNPQLVSDTDQGHESGMASSPHGARTVVRAKRTGKRFDNNPDYLVHRHKKTTHAYRIGIRLPKERLQCFPRYNGKVKDFSYQWSGAFVTFKFEPGRLHSIFKQRDIPAAIVVPPLPSSFPAGSRASAASVPSPLTAGQSSVSAGNSGPATPVTTQPLSGAGRTNAQTRRATSELLAATTDTTGPFGSYDQARLSPEAKLVETSAFLHSPLPLSSQLDSVYEDIPVSERLVRSNKMGPVKDTSNVHNTIQGVIQHLTDIQIQTHGYIPATQDLLVDKLTDLTQSLAELKHLTSTQDSPNNYIHQVAIAPEIVDYVDDGRNPDIFTRDFVEIVQRGNAVINGKQQAFKDFTEVFAQKLKEGIPGVSGQVDRVLKSAGFDEHEGSKPNGADVGESHESGNEEMPANG